MYAHQHGFRSKASTITSIADITSFLQKAIDDKLYAFSMALDISKAFDSLNHDILLHKLESYGFRGITHQWFKSYLHNRYQYVVHNGMYSDLCLLTHGVPQGSVLGPILFALYINDLYLAVPDCKVVLFADDSTIMYSNKHSLDFKYYIETVGNVLHAWFTCNLLVINAKKTHYLIYSLARIVNSTIYNVSIGEHVINRVEYGRFLGIIIDEHFSWKQHCEAVRLKLCKSLGMLSVCVHFLPVACMKQLYYAFVYPTLSYGIEFWGNAQDQYLHPIRILHKKCIRLVCGVHRLFHCEPVAKANKLLLFDDIYVAACVTFLFKVKHNLYINAISSLLVNPMSLNVMPTRYSQLNFYVHSTNFLISRHSFLFNSVKLWNNLPVHLKEARNLNTFKSLLKISLLVSYEV
jgi:hypothetical protein